MHVSDCGGLADDAPVEMTCRTCGYKTGWITLGSVGGLAASKRGVPCPHQIFAQGTVAFRRRGNARSHARG